MNGQRFSLKPFPSACFLPVAKITGDIDRSSGRLAVSYELFGPLSEIAIPAPVDIPVRKKALWEDTCFEFFLAMEDRTKYWEFNLSPSGNWNSYSFKSYRQGMQEEPAFKSLPFRIGMQPELLRLSLNIDLGSIFPSDDSLKVAVSAVIKFKTGEISYWALIHPGTQPDFHHRDSFILKL
jgi:hypothetical protein